MTKKFVRIAAFFAIFAMITAMAAGILVRVIFSPSRVRALAVHHLSRRLGREVSVGDARVSFRGALILSDIKIFEKVGLLTDVSRPRAGIRREVFSCERLEMRQNIAALLKGSRQIALLRIVSPRLSVEAANGGTFNVPDFRRTFTAPRYKYERGAAKPSEDAKPSDSAAAVVIGISRVEIENGAIDVRTSGKSDYKLEKIRISFEGADGKGLLSGDLEFVGKDLTAGVSFNASIDDAAREITVENLSVTAKGASMAGNALVRNYSDADRLSYVINLSVKPSDLEKIFGGDGAKVLAFTGKNAMVKISGDISRTSVAAKIEGLGIVVNF
jgi:uncharacterized protein involved in outer membrane biogenesis